MEQPASAHVYAHPAFHIAQPYPPSYHLVLTYLGKTEGEFPGGSRGEVDAPCQFRLNATWLALSCARAFLNGLRRVPAFIGFVKRHFSVDSDQGVVPPCGGSREHG